MPYTTSMEQVTLCGRILLIALFFCQTGETLAHAAEGPLNLEPIVVRKAEAGLIDAWSLSEEQLHSFPVGSFLESLKVFPVDIQSRSFAGGIQSDYSLRGASFEGTLFLVDGVRVNDPQTAHHNADIPLTSADIERVEVIPGASSALYGPDAMAGAIQFHLARPRGDTALVDISGGSFAAWSELVSVTREYDESGGFRISAENSQSDGFSDGTDFKKFTTNLYTQWGSDDAEGSALVGYQEKEFGAYDFYTPGSGFFSQEWTKTYLVSTGLTVDTGSVTVRPHLLLRRHTDKFLLDKTLARTRYLNHHRTDVYTPSVYVCLTPREWLDIGMGAEYSQEHIASTNLGDHRRAHTGIYADERIALSDRLTGGMSLRIDDYDGFDRVYTGSFGVRHALGDYDSLRAAVSRNMRVPSFTELYYLDPVTVGNPDARAQKAWSYELSWARETGNRALISTVFFRNEYDTIDWVKHSADEPLWRLENIDGAQAFGIENSVRLVTAQALSVTVYYTYTDKRIDDNGLLHKYGFNYARHQAVLGIQVPLPYALHTVLVSYKKRPGRDGWLLIDTKLSRSLNEHAEVYCSAENLLNVEYQEIPGIPQPGRSLKAGVRFEW